MKLDLLCPVEVQGVTVKTNTQTQEPYALFKLFNLSDRVVNAVSFNMHAYDAFGGELGVVRVDFTELEGVPKEFFAANKAVSLTEFADAKHIEAEILEVHFAEGEAYIQEAELAEYAVCEADAETQSCLALAAGEDAVCYAKEEGTHWVCVCGRPNVNESEFCVRCSREKAASLELFGSREALNQTIADQAALAQQMEEERLRAEAEAKAAFVKKAEKVVLATISAIVALFVLYFVGVFAVNGIKTMQGNSAAKNGDYLAAYSHYAAAGNEGKLAEVSEQVLGNTGSNLIQSGFMAADEENIYYVDGMCNIYKESKATGEKARLGEGAGLFLNVSDGWLYYLDVQNGQTLCRISTDGSVTETVYTAGEESYFMNLSLVGNELFFCLQEPREDLTPEEQEQIALTGEGSPYAQHLYRLTIGKEKPVLVSENNISQFINYKGKIYYINAEDGNAVYSMNRKGGDVTKLVSGPIYGFALENDILYYVDGTVVEETGMPKLALIAADLDGNYQETLIDDQMVLAFAPENGAIYYVDYAPEGITLYLRKDGGKDLLYAGCQQFNVVDGYVGYVNMEGQIIKMTYDKTSTEVIEVPASDEAIVVE